MKKALVLLALLMGCFQPAFATLTVGNVPVTKTGGPSPVLQNSDITDTSGNVGIGSSTPGQALDVNGTVRSTAFVATGSGVSYVTGNFGIGSVNPGASLIINSGNVGIGSAAPGGAIDVNTGTICLSHVCNSTWGAASQWNNGSSSSLNYTLGNVGIGTSTVPKQLTIGTLGQLGVDSTGNITTSGGYTQTGTGLDLFTGNVGIGSPTPGAALEVQGTLRVFSAGTNASLTGANLGIGTSNPAVSLLDVANNVSIGTAYAATIAAPANGMIVQGNVGFGSSNPGMKLDVTGTVRISAAVLNTGITTDATKTDATVCEDTTTHQFYSGSGTLGICLGTSSARYKHDINSLKLGLNAITQLKPVTFFYKDGYGDNGARLQYGLLAEDVANIIPNLVALDKDNKPNSVDLLGMTPIMINAIQYQQEQLNWMGIVILFLFVMMIGTYWKK